MKRKAKDYLIIGLKGMAMGAADVVPGVSGGTIAFISGIYQELLTSISNFNLELFKDFKKGGIKSMWNKVNGNFLTALFIGIFISIITLAKALKHFLDKEPILVWSFFFGLVLASVIYISKEISKWSFIYFIVAVLSAFLAYKTTILSPLNFENGSLVYFFIVGLIAICAMILPGISGAFILVLFNAYKPVLEAINNLDIKILSVFGLGAIVGLLSFSRVLKWLFLNYKNFTLFTLIGFIVGSLNKIWPWKETIDWKINSHGIKEPLIQQSILPSSYDGDSKLAASIFLSVIGFAFIFAIEKLATNKK